MTIKKLSLVNLEALADFFSRNYGSDFFDPFELNRESAIRILNEFGKNLYYGWFEGEIIIGFGMLRWYNDFSSPTLGLIVDKNYRGQGIGNQIYVWLFAKAEGFGCLDIISIVDKNNIASVYIAKKLGMHELGENDLLVPGRYDFSKYFSEHSNKAILVKNFFTFVNIAPILVTVYNRKEHFKKCIESLKENKLASKTHLFVAIDAPFKREHKADNDSVIEYAKNISGFKEITLIIREKNLGAVENFFSAIREVLSKYDRLIFSEDDNIFSEDFLYFVNKGLNAFNNREDIFSICAYNLPIETPLVNKGENIYINNFFSGWGFGVWKNKWEKIDWNKEVVLQKTRDFLKDYKSVYRYNKIANNLILNLIYMIKNNTVYGDCYIALYQYLNKQNSIFPIVSRVKNIGHDGSGAHCKNKEKNNIYSSQDVYIGDDNYEFYLDITNDKKIAKLIQKYFKRNIIKNIYTLMLLILVNFGLLYRKK